MWFKKFHPKIFPELGDIPVGKLTNFGNFQENPPDFRDFPRKVLKKCPNHPKLKFACKFFSHSVVM